MSQTTENMYLEGNFAPVTEEVTVTELEVTGVIPDHLDGRYLRNGPNPADEPDPARYHWFLGDGMVHGVRLRDGRAEWYRNRWVRSASVARTLGEERRPGPWRGGADFAANTNVIGHTGRTFAVVEAGARPYELTDELDTVGPTDFGGTLVGGYTAHPKLDPDTGELHAVAYCPFWGNHLRYTVTGTDGRVRRTVSIEVTGMPMVHDFSLTENYVVIYDLPVTMDLSTLGRGGALLGRLVGNRAAPKSLTALIHRLSSSGRVRISELGLPYRWDPSYPARVGVLPREADPSAIRWFDVEPCFVFHAMNAYEEDGSIVLDVVRHERMFATDHHGPNEGPHTLERWTVDLAAGKVIEERIDDRGQEFPRVDERRVGKRHRYGYSVGFATTGTESALVRHDFGGGTSTSRSFGADHGVSEFVHVPRSDDAAEDDGVLMGFVHDLANGTSDLRLVDAATLEDVAQIHIPARIPFGFHGNWISS